MNAQDRRTNRNAIERVLGAKTFNKLFPVILTDNGSEFSNPKEIEYRDAVPSLRTKVFYCDSYRSCQKGNVENMNKQLRKYFPKGKSIDYLTDEDVVSINNIIISQKVMSLGGSSPKEVFESIYGSRLLYLLLK